MWAARQARCREWLSGKQTFLPRVDSNDKDLLWLLVPTNLDKTAVLKDATPAIYQNAQRLVLLALCCSYHVSPLLQRELALIRNVNQ